MSQEDLDTVMMEDLGADLDFLDDLIGLDTMDCYKLEPSLSGFLDTSSQHSPLGPELPMLPMVPSVSLQPLTPESIPSPISSHGPFTHSSPSPPIGLQQQPLTLTMTGIVPELTVKSSSSAFSPSSIPQQNQQVQFTTSTGSSFGTFGIPFTSTVFGNTVLLPQIQLAVVENHNQVTLLKKNDKLPVKRLEKDSNHGGRKKEPTNRRSSHNAIERRYRSSINDKILELKSLVCAPSEPNEKVHKAAILRSSIDTIRYLQNTNSRLDKENRELKKSMTKCSTCRTDRTLRGILTASSPSTPPPTETDSTDSSNPPSPNEVVKPGAHALLAKSPLVLFSIVTGLFLINPITNNSPIVPTDYTDDHPHSRVERSADTTKTSIDLDENFYGLWVPRILTILVNLFLFIVLYYMTGRIIRRVGRNKYTTEKLRKLNSKNWTKATTPGTKMEEIALILAEFDSFPTNIVTRWLSTMVNLAIMPFQLRRKRTNVKYAEINEEISFLYLEYGKLGGKGLFPYVRAINFSPMNKKLVIRSLIQAKSKFLLKFALIWTNFAEDAAFGTPEGLMFLKNYVAKGVTLGDFVLGGSISGADDMSLMVSKFREESLATGVHQLLYFGAGTELFRIVLKTCGKNEKLVQFWSAVMWAESEWIRGGGRIETLKRLCRLIDELWKYLKQREEQANLLKAIYKVHLCKRALMMGQIPDKETLDIASAYLRDSITTSTDKPKRVIQVIWCLAAEWILECRLELWEERKEMGGFSKDLDTLRSLTHYIPGILPSVYLYEACQRLMNYAAPGRTQQLLDASLRQIRTSQRALLCNNNDDWDLLQATQGEGSTPAPCNLGKKTKELNLVREKRKAFALYLKCKYLPNQVITCPGEKAGMLKEALKALERIGEKKKINDCLEMIRSLGQSITLH